MGQPFLQPSESKAGKVAKPYKHHKLNLPKTYVTKRGQMVLFTAPEDMIMGQSCTIHKKELSSTSKQAAHELKTTNTLAQSALNYGQAEATDISESHDTNKKWTEHKAQGAWQDQRMVKAGHFNDVYLRSLKKSVAARASQDCMVEDLEEAEMEVKEADIHVDMDTQLIPECDSGLGHSIGPSPSGRLSSHSHHSESSTIINIPHGSVSSEEVRPPLTEIPAEVGDQGAPTGRGSEEDGGLAALRKELNLYKVKGDSDPKKPTKSGKKRQHPKSHTPGSSGGGGSSTSKLSPNTSATLRPKAKKANAGSKLNPLATESLSSIKSEASKTSKGKNRKRRGRKQHQEPVGKEEEQEEAMMVAEKENDDLSGALEITALQLAMAEGEGQGEGKGEELVRRNHRVSRAEERKLEVERKREEKRELERQRRLEEEERQRLKEEIARSQMAQEVDKILDEDDDSNIDTDHSPIPSPPSSPSPSSNQQQLLDALEKAKLRENRLLLSFQGEQTEQMMTTEMREVEEAVERARLAAEELERKRKEAERRRREQEEAKRLEEERKRREEERVKAELTKRALTIQAKVDSLHKECAKSIEAERKTKRYQDSLAQSIMFSYFSYVPPSSKQKSDKKTTRGKRPQKLRS